MVDSSHDTRTHTVRLELVDEAGELLRALDPIADNGGNLLSIFHRRGDITPRGNIPVEVDFEANAIQYERIIDGLQEADIKVIQTGTERYSESVTVLLSGHLVDTGLSDTLQQIREKTNTSITSLSLNAPEGTDDVSSARLRIATATGDVEETLTALGTIASEKDLRLIEPLLPESDH